MPPRQGDACDRPAVPWREPPQPVNRRPERCDRAPREVVGPAANTPSCASRRGRGRIRISCQTMKISSKYGLIASHYWLPIQWVIFGGIRRASDLDFCARTLCFLLSNGGSMFKDSRASDSEG